jgi:serine/threonine protein kinase
MVLECCDFSLSQLVERPQLSVGNWRDEIKRPRLTTLKVLNIAHDTASAIKYMHDKETVHLDIKPGEYTPSAVISPAGPYIH